MIDCSLPLDRSLLSPLRKYSPNTLRRGIPYTFLHFAETVFRGSQSPKSAMNTYDTFKCLQIGRHCSQSYSCSQSSDCSPSEVHAHLSQSSHHILNHLQVSNRSKYISVECFYFLQTSLFSPFPYSPLPSSF